MDSRSAAIASLGRLDKGNKEITQQIAVLSDRAALHGSLGGDLGTWEIAETPARSLRWRLC